MLVKLFLRSRDETGSPRGYMRFWNRRVRTPCGTTILFFQYNEFLSTEKTRPKMIIKSTISLLYVKISLLYTLKCRNNPYIQYNFRGVSLRTCRKSTRAKMPMFLIILQRKSGNGQVKNACNHQPDCRWR